MILYYLTCNLVIRQIELFTVDAMDKITVILNKLH